MGVGAQGGGGGGGRENGGGDFSDSDEVEGRWGCEIPAYAYSSCCSAWVAKCSRTTPRSSVIPQGSHCRSAPIPNGRGGNERVGTGTEI